MWDNYKTICIYLIESTLMNARYRSHAYSHHNSPTMMLGTFWHNLAVFPGDTSVVLRHGMNPFCTAYTGLPLQERVLMFNHYLMIIVNCSGFTSGIMCISASPSCVCKRKRNIYSYCCKHVVPIEVLYKISKLFVYLQPTSILHSSVSMQYWASVGFLTTCRWNQHEICTANTCRSRYIIRL